VIECGADEVEAEAAGLDGIEGTAGPLGGGVAVIAVIAEAEAEGGVELLAGEADEASLLVLVDVANDVGAGFIDAEDDELDLGRGEAGIDGELPDEVADSAQVCGMTREFDLPLHRSMGGRHAIFFTRGNIRLEGGMGKPGVFWEEIILTAD
jgi:hypothetical protein